MDFSTLQILSASQKRKGELRKHLKYLNAILILKQEDEKAARAVSRNNTEMIVCGNGSTGILHP